MMKKAAALSICLLLCGSACAQSITLYGESRHGDADILQQEAQRWYTAYHEQGMRHLFVEMPYYTAEYLNWWMQEDSNAILDEVYANLAGTQAYTLATRTFYLTIKEQCPETVFHGTDVGHQYRTTGERFLRDLEQRGMQDTPAYALAQEAIEQGRTYYATGDEAYRENTMTANFIREYDALAGETVTGIYGSAHTMLGAVNHDESVYCMAEQLRQHYGDVIRSVLLMREVQPLRMDVLEANGKAYQAAYFGSQDLSGLLPGYESRAFWRLEDAYADFANCPKTGDVLPYSNFPMSVETGQVFVIDYHMTDGTVSRLYYRSDGNLWNGSPITEQFMYESSH